ncbi:MAG: radical SAM protein [Candidatus Omnitrophota bacterium]|nr:MAG: radical SAM protein [Candidatus Omnitrophota bacterium]
MFKHKNLDKKSLIDKACRHAYRLLGSCSICPRICKVNRCKDQKGFCKTGLSALVHSYLPHYGEEPPISGDRGSGTVFFSRCNLQCVYCQNYKFSQNESGKPVTPGDLAEFMLKLQTLGCHNINLVTPTHVMPQILMALNIAVDNGLNIPIIYNTSGYELPEMIELLDGIIDIYLTDMRYGDDSQASKYSNARNYTHYNRESLKEMFRQVGNVELDSAGIIKKGVIVRHLVLPDNISGTEEVMRFISKDVSSELFVSLMSQYTPCYKANEYVELSKGLSPEEYVYAEEIMHKYGLHNGWIQENSSSQEFLGTNIESIDNGQSK